MVILSLLALALCHLGLRNSLAESECQFSKSYEMGWRNPSVTSDTGGCVVRPPMCVIRLWSMAKDRKGQGLVWNPVQETVFELNFLGDFGPDSLDPITIQFSKIQLLTEDNVCCPEQLEGRTV